MQETVFLQVTHLELANSGIMLVHIGLENICRVFWVVFLCYKNLYTWNGNLFLFNEVITITVLTYVVLNFSVYIALKVRSYFISVIIKALGDDKTK